MTTHEYSHSTPEIEEVAGAHVMIQGDGEYVHCYEWFPGLDHPISVGDLLRTGDYIDGRDYTNLETGAV